MTFKKQSGCAFAWIAGLALLVGLTPSAARAQYKVTNLVSNQAGMANHQDTQLVNSWGIAFAPTGAFWVSDNGTGLSTLYNGMGVKQSLVVTVPPASGTGTGSPTGIVFNPSTKFVISQGTKSGPATFIFDTLDGTISGWNGAVNGTSAIVAVNNPGASYTGLAIGTNAGAEFIFAADNAGKKVDIYDGNFNFVSSFTDPGAPSTSAPYGIQAIGSNLFVTYTGGIGGDLVDVFSTAGVLVKRFATGGTLNSAWGIAQAPTNFGPVSKDILIGNLGDGKINIFSTAGRFIGQLQDTNHKVIVISELWGLTFGGGGSLNGKKNQLFFTSGPGFYSDGLFGIITFQ